LLKFAGVLDGISEWTGKVVSWLTLALVLITTWDVLARYVFKSGSVALQELEWHIFSVIFLAAAAFTLRWDGHVRVDIFYAKLGRRGKAIINLAGTLIFLLPFCAMIIYTSAGFVASSWKFGEASGDPGGLPARYILKAMIPLGFALLSVQGVSMAIRSLVTILTPSREDVKE